MINDQTESAQEPIALSGSGAAPDRATEAQSTDKSGPAGSRELTPAEKEQVVKLEARDREVRSHEAAHLAAAGGAATGGATYTYQQGPDGKLYAIGGEVPIQLSPGRTPEETLANAAQIRAAAMAPADPSGQDMAVAAEASEMEDQARQQIAAESRSSGLAHQVSAAYGHGNSSSQPQLISATA